MVLLYAFSRMTGMTPSGNNMPIGITELCPTVTDGWQLTLPVNMTIHVGRFSHVQKKNHRDIHHYIYIFIIIPCNVVWIPHYRFQLSTNHQISLSYCWLYSTPPQTKVLFWGVLYIPWIPGKIRRHKHQKKKNISYCNLQWNHSTHGHGYIALSTGKQKKTAAPTKRLSRRCRRDGFWQDMDRGSSKLGATNYHLVIWQFAMERSTIFNR